MASSGVRCSSASDLPPSPNRYVCRNDCLAARGVIVPVGGDVPELVD